MSQFEALVADIVHAFYDRFPAALPADDHTLTLSALKDLGSIDEAIRYVVAQEVDSVLRMSLRDQLGYLSKRPKLDPRLPEELVDSIVEVDQRRNLMVHNRGKVNKLYLSRVCPGLVNSYDSKEGQSLDVTDTYLTHAIDDVLLAGLLLVQHAWRKWEKDTISEADSGLIATAFESLTDGRNDLVVRIAELCESIPFASDENKKIVTINRAIALRDLGRTTDMLALIDSVDWSSSAPRFKLAVAALKDDEAEFFRLLPKAVSADDLTRHELETWPLFKPVREKDGFWKCAEAFLPKSTPVAGKELVEIAAHAS